jgi:hypothetical protein
VQVRTPSMPNKGRHHSMPKKSRKVRCCTKCGEKSRGHVGPTGKACEWIKPDLEEEIVKKPVRKRSLKDFAEKRLPKKPVVPVYDSATSSSNSESDGESSEPESESCNEDDSGGKYQALTNQVTLLSTSLKKLLEREAVRAGKPSSSAKSSRAASSAKAVSSKSSRESRHTASSEGNKPRATTTSLSKDKELNSLLAAYNEGEEEFLASFDGTRRKSANRQKKSGEVAKKPLYIVDYLSKLDSCYSDDENAVQLTNGLELSIKTKSKRVDPKDVSVGQWISANCRILALLTPTMSDDEFDSYQEYTSQIGDLLQLYTVSSVMQLDHAHRKHVHATGRAWDHISCHLDKIHLRLKGFHGYQDDSVSKHSNPDHKLDKSDKKRKSNRPCFAYNEKRGCKYGDGCNYKHKCSERGCGKDHPKFEHERFRGVASA